VFDKSVRRDGTLERADFRYDLSDNSYVCPAGNRLRPRNRNFTQARCDVGQDGFIRDNARQQDCAGFDLRQSCMPNMPAAKSFVLSTKAPMTLPAILPLLLPI
jgi:hypothetical protein